jgi:hypothetical protein
MNQPPIQVEKHPPERRRSRTVTTHCGCCCCCCCCLHTIGGLIGAAICSAVARKPAAGSATQEYYDRAFPAPQPASRSAFSPAFLYWVILVILIQAVFLISCAGFSHGPFNPESLEGVGAGLMILAIFLPLVQIVASVLAIIAAAITDTEHAAARIWVVAKITFGSLIGTAIGIGIMFLLFAVCTIR